MSEENNLDQVSNYGLPPRYKPISILGKGGMGVVLKALDIQMGREVSVKLLNLELAADERLKERFIREAKALASLDHANIIKLLSWGFTELGSPYHILEYFDGEPLSALFERQKRLSPLQFQQVFSQIISGLSHAHEHGIIHRDLKPSNILINPDSRHCKIIDFGVAKIVEEESESSDLTRTNALLGSPAYMSPEQCKGKPADTRSDIYSLACIMYEALTGRPPFLSDNALDLMYQHSTADWVHIASILTQSEFQELAFLIDTCLAKDPAARPQNVQEISSKFRSIIPKQDTGALFLIKSGALKSSQAGALLLAVSAIALAIVAGLSFYFARTSKTKEEARLLAEKVKAKKSPKQEIVEELAAKLSRLEKNIESEDDPEKKQALRLSYVKLARELATRTADLGDHKGAERIYASILPYCKYADDPDIAASVTLIDIAKERNCLGRYKAVIEACDQGIMQLRGTEYAQGENISQLYVLKTEACIQLSDFLQARSAFQQVANIWRNNLSPLPEGPMDEAAELHRISKTHSLMEMTLKKTKGVKDKKLKNSALELIAVLQEYSESSASKAALENAGKFKVPNRYSSTPSFGDLFKRLKKTANKIQKDVEALKESQDFRGLDKTTAPSSDVPSK